MLLPVSRQKADGDSSETPDFESKNTVAQDLGQEVTGSTSTTIAVEASNLVSAPFFNGVILTEEGEINITDDEQTEPAA